MTGRGKSARNRELIAVAQEVLAGIQPASVRAVCYQLFNRGLISGMSKLETNRVSTQLRDAREQGQIPWSWIVDETREAERVNAFRDPDEYVDVVKQAYRRDRWTDQPRRIQVWSEKGTVRGTLAPALQRFGVTFQVMHGYTSTTTAHQVAEDSLDDDRVLTVLYVGDWDPSGLHMSAVDLPRRLERYQGNVEVIRVALSEVDVAGSRLPSFAADSKRKDPRYHWFVERYGHRCWELDAMSPPVLRERVELAILSRIEPDAWLRADVTEAAELESLSTILSAWPGISRQASKCDPEAAR